MEGKTRDYKTKILTILFCLSVFVVSALNVTSAYFTSVDTRSGDVNFHTVSLEINSSNAGNVMFTQTINVLPGDTINFDHISVENVGSADVYSIISLEVISTKADSSIFKDTVWCNLSNSMINVENLEQNSVKATEIASGDYVDLTLTYTFDGNVYNDSFKNATSKVVLTAYCIQKDNLEQVGEIQDKGLIATYLLINNQIA